MDSPQAIHLCDDHRQPCSPSMTYYNGCWLCRRGFGGLSLCSESALRLSSRPAHPMDGILCLYLYKRMNHQPNISLQAVMTLTEWSERTVRRRIADGSLKCASESGSYNKALICFESIMHDVCIPLSSSDIEIIKEADAGDAAAQSDLGLLFVSHEKWKSAMYWLEQAAKQDFPDAMQWLGECYLYGHGVKKDEHLAVMWIAKAASLGHTIAKLQIEALRPGTDDAEAAFKGYEGGS